MTDSNAGGAVRKGQFVKGDPRINRDHGPLNAEAAAWGIKAKNALAKKLSPDAWAEVVAKKAKAGIPWAVQLYRETFIEMAPQKHEVSGVLTFKFGENGNGNGEAHE